MDLDKTLVIWELINLDKAIPLAKIQKRIKTKYCLDLVMKANRMVTVNREQAHIFKLSEDGEDHMMDGEDTCVFGQEEYDDVRAGGRAKIIEPSDKITAICLSKNGRYLLANVSM